MNNYQFRPAQSNDLDTLIELMDAHARYEQAGFDATGKRAQWEDAFFGNPPKVHCFVVEVAGAVEGYFTYTFDFSTWDAAYYLHLDCLYLNESVRGQGIGAAILSYLKEIATAHHCVNVQWQTPDFNEPAIRFYKRNGAAGKPKIRFFL